MMARDSATAPRWSQPAALAAASVVVALTAFLYGVLREIPSRTSGPRYAPTVLFQDTAGLPRQDLVIVGPDGLDRFPDSRGMLCTGTEDTEQIFEVLEGNTRRWLMRFRLQTGSEGLVQIRVPR